MKRIIAMVLLAALLLTGCVGKQQPQQKVPATDLTASLQRKAPKADAHFSAEASAAVTDFSVRLLQNTAQSGENTLISPLSVLYALGMTANGAAGETAAQMESTLGLPASDWNEALGGYLSARSEDGALHIANGIWFRNEKHSLTVEDAFLQTCADYYDAPACAAPFDASTVEEINAFVNTHTAGMIPSILDEIPSEAVMYLVNALAFEHAWRVPYEKDQVCDGKFDGTEDAQFLCSLEGRYLENADCTGVMKYYEGNYAFIGLLPREGTGTDELVVSLTGAGLRELVESVQQTEVSTQIPVFSTEYDAELSGPLTAMGMPDAFNGESADFSALGHSEEGNLYISRVLHRTFIEVDAQGTKTAAATAVEMSDEAAVELSEPPKVVCLDRPFVYAIWDTEAEIPVFLGVVNELAG